MAESMCKKMLHENLQSAPYFSDIMVSSSGTYAVDGIPPTIGAIKVMQEIGIDISQHRSRRITREQILSADLILVMECRHLEAVRSLSENAKEKSWLLKQYVKADNNPEIRDPLGGPLEVYEECRIIIQDAIEKLIRIL
jgi:protein-tyrosine-phosphatase